MPCATPPTWKPAVGAVESRLAALGQALQAHDASATEGAATELHRRA